MLLVAEIVTIHTNPKRQRGNDSATSLALWVSVRHNRAVYLRYHSINAGKMTGNLGRLAPFSKMVTAAPALLAATGDNFRAQRRNGKLYFARPE